MSIMLPHLAFSRRSVDVTALYLQHARLVRRVLRTHGVPLDSLEDALQDVFVVAFRRYDDFVPHASRKTWLFAIAVKVARDYRRRMHRKGGLVTLHEHEQASPRTDPLAAAIAHQSLQVLGAKLHDLACESREVFILAELEQLTAREIAQRLSLNLNTVYSRLRAARRDLDLAAERQTPQRE